jgi:hypothetical protein
MKSALEAASSEGERVGPEAGAAIAETLRRLGSHPLCPRTALAYRRTHDVWPVQGVVLRTIPAQRVAHLPRRQAAGGDSQGGWDSHDAQFVRDPSAGKRHRRGEHPALAGAAPGAPRAGPYRPSRPSTCRGRPLGRPVGARSAPVVDTGGRCNRSSGEARRTLLLEAGPLDSPFLRVVNHSSSSGLSAR